ncbi:MAG TPA: AraC family transcriptional regulator [Xanthobacteraceae bacterium]|jgi:AraC-like DNA-binding protein|nr:AraC family transcriptional regulator [Xanthobacteraceae bacterium]
MTEKATSFRFSTADLIERERASILREVLGRTMFQFDLEPLPECSLDMAIYSLPGIGILRSSYTGMRTIRTRDLIADGQDKIVLLINVSGPLVASFGSQDVILENNEASLTSTIEPAGITRRKHGSGISISIPHSAVADLVKDFDGRVMRIIERDDPALKLLRNYVGLIGSSAEWNALVPQDVIADNIRDLIISLIGPTRDAAALAEIRGLAAARLYAIQKDVIRHVADPNLSIEAVATRQQISPQKINWLLDSDGTTFPDLVLKHRLLRAYRRLTHSRYSSRVITAIASELGFDRLSYFNRVFRLRFGEAPSDIRQAAQEKNKD